MNRKESKEQNDTSIIIGHLPKRLQRKFAESCLENTENGSGKPNAASRPCVAHIAHNDKHDDSVAFTSNLKSSSKDTEDIDNERFYLKQQNNNAAEIKSVCSILPGVLRINRARYMEKKDDENSLQIVENKKNSPVHRRENLLRDVIPISPARVPLKQPSQPIWFRNLDDISIAKDLPQLYESLMSLIRRNAVLLEWDYFCEIHTELLQIFTEMLLQNLKFVCEQKVDTFFWKLLYYNIREYLKAQPSTECSEIILSLIENGNSFYQRLHELLCKKYLHNKNSGELMRKFEFIAKVADQKILICLGDLSRYRVKHLQLLDYSQAFKFYQEAQRLIPTNAIPYNQLAIVSLHARKQFDAVYFHMRSLMSSNPIVSAKESLLVLFDEIGKKYEENESINCPTKRKPLEKKRKSSSPSMRKEVWVHPDGARLLHRTEIKDDNEYDSNSSEESHLKGLSSEEVAKRFVSIYLYVIGKLYSAIGMESIQLYEKKLFSQLDVLVTSYPLLIKRNRLLKILALNIFLIEHNMLKDSRREIQYRAFIFSNGCFGLILKKFNAIFNMESLSIIDDMDKVIFYDLNTLLQYARIYIKWLCQNVHIWEPIRSQDHVFTDIWNELSIFFSKVERFSKTLSRSNSIDEPVIFEEDNFLLGFTPLSIAYNKHDTIQNPSDELSQFIGRIRQIRDFQEYFKENGHLLKIADIATSSYLSETKSRRSFERMSDSDDLESSSDDDNHKKRDEIVENGSSSPKNFQDDQMKELAKLKKELEAKTHIKKIYDEKLQEILNVDVKLRIEVRPKYLLPDTNCFIDHLGDFERLVTEFKCFILIVPLTVVKELEGLSKGVKLEEHDNFIQKQRIHHYDDVSTCARKSLEFIKSPKNGVRCATTKGSIINASLFGLVDEEYVSNDDKILATALALSKNMSNEVRKVGKCCIRTELVLITSDRNLRVKALSRNLAVSELNEFLQWAKDCKK